MMEEIYEKYSEERGYLRNILFLWLGVRLIYSGFETYLSVTIIQNPAVRILSILASLAIYLMVARDIYKGQRAGASVMLFGAVYQAYLLVSNFDLMGFKIYSPLMKAYAVIMAVVTVLQTATAIYILVSKMLKPYFEEIKSLEKEG